MAAPVAPLDTSKISSARLELGWVCITLRSMSAIDLAAVSTDRGWIVQNSIARRLICKNRSPVISGRFLLLAAPLWRGRGQCFQSRLRLPKAAWGLCRRCPKRLSAQPTAALRGILFAKHAGRRLPQLLSRHRAGPSGQRTDAGTRRYLDDSGAGGRGLADGMAGSEPERHPGDARLRRRQAVA
jgi:hypothetical protein